jgi:hypothetical protein
MLSKVKAEHRLYFPAPGAESVSLVPGFGGFPGTYDDMTLVAVAPAMKGFVGFFGDVNAEDATANILSTLSRRLAQLAAEEVE